MHWSYQDLLSLPWPVYDELLRYLNEPKSPRLGLGADEQLIEM
jgi:hypothetical protein